MPKPTIYGRKCQAYGSEGTVYVSTSQAIKPNATRPPMIDWSVGSARLSWCRLSAINSGLKSDGRNLAITFTHFQCVPRGTEDSPRTGVLASRANCAPPTVAQSLPFFLNLLSFRVLLLRERAKRQTPFPPKIILKRKRVIFVTLPRRSVASRLAYLHRARQNSERSPAQSFGQTRYRIRSPLTGG